MGRWIVGLGILAVLVAGCGSSGGKQTATSASELASVQGKYDPSVDPADFVARVDNPLWPLKPGTAFHYVGTRGNTPQTDDELVTQQTKRIIGIRLRGRSRHRLRARAADRADARLLRAGQERER